MVETIEIKDFIKTGNFGEFKEIHFGMTRDKLIEIIGDTEHKGFTYKKSKFPSILLYGNIEFYFEEGENGRLNGFQIIPFRPRTDKYNLKINLSFIEPKLRFDSALKILDSESIKYKLVKNEFDSNDVRRIETEGKVQLIFTAEINKTYLIHKVSKFVELNSEQIKMKQVNFSIPESEYLKLRKKAIETRKSIQNICKEIILDKLNKK